MHYTKMRIRDTEFLLPVDSEIAAEDELGAYNLNMIRLERCQEFTGQSVVTFGGAVEGDSADRQGPNP
jgi:proteasome assembly chaperone (PAC2) family protein